MCSTKPEVGIILHKICLTFVFTFLLLLTGSTVSKAEVDTIPNYDPLWLSLVSEGTAEIGGVANVSVLLDSVPAWFDMGGFELLLAYDGLILTLDSVAPGSFIDQCGWEYFTYSQGLPNCSGPLCPDGTIRVIAVADLVSTPGDPSCYTASNGSLCDMIFSVTGDSSQALNSTSIDFFWNECGDNSVASVAGDTLFISYEVFDETGNITANDSFPTYFGAPDECIIPPNPAVRGINFRSTEILLDTLHNDTTLIDPVWVGISTDYNAGLGTNASVTVNLDIVPDWFSTGGFDIKMAYDPVQLTVDSVLPGTMLLDCGWEYFTFRVDDSTDCSDTLCPQGIIRVVSIASLGGIPGDPTCFGESGGSLFEISFQVTTDIAYASTFARVDFLWNDCGDNAFSNYSGDALYLSNEVYDNTGIITANAPFPTFFGAPDTCLSNYPNVTRAINFSSGGVYIGAGSEISPVWVKIESDGYGEISSFTEISVSLDSVPPWFEMGGFDMLLAYDALLLNVDSVSPGTIYNSCSWEYFSYRFEEPECVDTLCPDGLLRVVALANINNGTPEPTCFSADSGTLFDISFAITNDTSLLCSSADVRFYWNDCGDNSIASVTGDSLYISQNVYDRLGSDITADMSFPTYTGAPGECLLNAPSPAIRAVNYKSGVVNIEGIDGVDWIDDPCRGDINVNTIHCELADAFLFRDYFLYGLSVLDIQLEQQISETDLNNDGLTLSFADYIYLWRIINGDILPSPQLKSNSAATDTAFFIQDTSKKVLRLDYPDSLVGAFLRFDSEIQPVGIDTSCYAGSRMILDIWSCGEPAIFTRDSIFSYTGDANLVEVQATYDGSTMIPTAIMQIDGSCCQVRGNIDSDPMGEITISDLVMLVDYMFQFGPEPQCLEEADINNTTVVDIADLILLVNYMFDSGPPPTPCD